LGRVLDRDRGALARRGLARERDLHRLVLVEAEERDVERAGHVRLVVRAGVTGGLVDLDRAVVAGRVVTVGAVAPLAVVAALGLAVAAVRVGVPAVRVVVPALGAVVAALVGLALAVV